MAAFVPLEVLSMEAETPDAYTIRFRQPDPAFSYKPGQYLVLETLVAGETQRRAFSLSSDPGADAHLAVTIKRIQNGKVSHHLWNTLKAGDHLRVHPPMGNFTVDLIPGVPRHLVLIGGGSGITPLMSILRSVLRAEPVSLITLIYGNHSSDSIIFRQQLAELQQQFPARLTVMHVLEKPSQNVTSIQGMLTEEVLRPLVEQAQARTDRPTRYYICGPTPMMDNAQRVLAALQIPTESIYREYYTAPITVSEESPTDEPEKREVKIKLDGKEHMLSVPKGKAVLDVAIAARLDPPYACQEGVCTTCRGKLITGRVHMPTHEGLTDAELQAGYVLTCQAHPLTDDVYIVYG